MARRKKKSRVRNIILAQLYILLALAVTILGLWIYREYQSTKSIENVQNLGRDAEVTPMPTLAPVRDIAIPTPIPTPEVMAKYKDLQTANPDIVGWLTIPDTQIDYPVMFKEGDNDWYLNHNFDGEDDVTGLLVLDKRCEPDGNGVNCLIHGHNMKSGAMFGSLKKYADKSYYKEHSVIYFDTLYEERIYDIIAVFRSQVYDENTTSFEFYDYIQIDDETTFKEYVDGAISQSLYDTGLTAEWGDKLLTLSTCEYTKANGRLVILARERRE